LVDGYDILFHDFDSPLGFKVNGALFTLTGESAPKCLECPSIFGYVLPQTLNLRAVRSLKSGILFGFPIFQVARAQGIVHIFKLSLCSLKLFSNVHDVSPSEIISRTGID
jgi:hypothetical protein